MVFMGSVIIVTTFCLLIAALVYVLGAFLLGRIFQKAGVPAWKAWVPVYRMWKMFQIGGVNGAWSLLSLIGGIAPVALLLFAVDASNGQVVLDQPPADQAAVAIILIVVSLVAALLFLVAYIRATWNITKKLGKSLVYMLLLVVNLGPSLWLWIMALDKSKWDDKLGSKSLAREMRLHKKSHHSGKK